jgi:4-amino-4-deoxy-L-arabinose transferase-like glycosyltransferase
MLNFFKKNKIKITFFLLLFAIAVFGFLIRFQDLDNNPAGLQYDEAQNGLKAIEIMENNDYQVFYSEEKNQGGLYLNALAISVKFLGANNFSIRLVSAFFGFLTLIGLYFLLKELKFSRLTILLGIFLMTTSFWHLVFSHIVYQEIVIPFILVWLFYFFFLGIRTINNWSFLLAGFLLGLGFYASFSFWLAPLVLLILIICLAFYRIDFLRKYWKAILIFGVTFFITVSPLFFYFYQNPGDLLNNFKNNPNIFNSQELSVSESFGKSFFAHVNAFYLYGDPNQRHNQAGEPLIPPAWAILFAFGFAFSIKNIISSLIYFKKRQSLDRLFRVSILAQLIFWIMLIPGFLLTENIPNSLKIIGVIPAVIIFIIIPFEYILRLRENLRKSPNFCLKPFRWRTLNVCLGFLIGIVLLTGLLEVYTFYFVWSKEPKTVEAFERKLFDFGKIAKQVFLKEQNVLVIPDNVLINEEENKTSFKTAEFSGYPEIKEFVFEHSLEAVKNIKECQNSNYILFEADQWLLDQFREACDNFEIEKKKAAGGYYEFWVLSN